MRTKVIWREEMQGCWDVAESRSSGQLAVCNDRKRQTQTVNTSDVKATLMARLTCTRNPKTRNITGRKGGRTTICDDQKQWTQTGKAFDVKAMSLPEGYQVIGQQGVKLNAGRWQRETDQSCKEEDE